MDTETWYERAAWIYVALISGSVLPIALRAYVDLSSTVPLWLALSVAALGATWPKVARRHRETDVVPA